MSLTLILVVALSSWCAASVVLGCALAKALFTPSRPRPARRVAPAPVTAITVSPRLERGYGRPLRTVA